MGIRRTQDAFRRQFSQVCPCLCLTGWLQTEPGEDGEVEAQRPLAPVVLPREACNRDGCGWSAAPYFGARRLREQSRPSTLLEECQRDTMILVSKAELNGWPVLLPAPSLRPWRES